MKQAIIQRGNIHYFKILDSTMNIASKFENNNYPNFTVVVAEQQNSGFGRMGRTWISDFGGLYFSIIVRPNIEADLIGNLGFAAAIDLAHVINDLYGINARLKWPNDILVDSCKICGILSRVRIKQNKITSMILGVGVNVNNKLNSLEFNAVSIFDILGIKAYNDDILLAFLDRFQNRITNFEAEKVVWQWKKINVTLGKFVKIITTKGEVKGLANNLNSKCGLEVLRENGSIETVIYGDCFHY